MAKDNNLFKKFHPKEANLSSALLKQTEIVDWAINKKIEFLLRCEHSHEYRRGYIQACNDLIATVNKTLV